MNASHPGNQSINQSIKSFIGPDGGWSLQESEINDVCVKML